MTNKERIEKILKRYEAAVVEMETLAAQGVAPLEALGLTIVLSGAFLNIVETTESPIPYWKTLTDLDDRIEKVIDYVTLLINWETARLLRDKEGKLP